MLLRIKAVATASVIVISVVGATVFNAWSDYKDTEARRLAAAVDVTKVVRQQLQNTATQADVILTMISRTIVEDFGVDRMAEPDRREQLKMACASLIGCHAIGIIGSDGISAANSAIVGRPNIDVNDRAFFQNAKKTSKLFIGPAIVTRLPGNPILFHLARGVFDIDDRFLGVITISMNTRYLTQFFEMMDFTLGPAVTVFKMNGDVVARNPEMHRHVGKNNLNGPLFTEYLPRAPRGTYRSVSLLDGKTRLSAYEAIPDLDLVVFAGISLESAFAVWQRRTERTAFVVGVLLLVLLTIFYIGYQALRREIALQAENTALGKLSNTDALTGIPNRRIFDLTITREWARHQRTHNPFSIVMVDVDCFKSYNDHYGHPAGDDVLRRVALALQTCLHREVDLVARYGGEEFAAILECSEAGAKAVAQRMLAAVEELGILHEFNSASRFVTVSIGVATANRRYNNALAVIDASDEALYRAKGKGRNRVCMAGHAKGLSLASVAGEAQ